MKFGLGLFLFLLFTGAVLAQEKQPPPVQDDLLQSVQDWMKDNLDDSVLQALQDIDQDRVKAFFKALEDRFADTNVFELSSAKEAAIRVLPVLQQFEETHPYAVWLQTHLDYLDTAEELKREVKPVPPKPGVRPPPPIPPLQLERAIWNRELSKRPLPPKAQSYVPKLKEIFIEERMPPELVWVAEVESSFDPQARSPVGAAGMFQLMPATAKSLNLSSFPWDERYQPEKSAHAAARYLRHLHDRFGDWQLALAAYNAGEGRVDNLLKQNKAHTFDAIAHRLPAETQMYVPKIEATIRKREGRTLADLTMPAKG